MEVERDSCGFRVAQGVASHMMATALCKSPHSSRFPTGMATASSPWSSADEEFLLALGVGSALPSWLHSQRYLERRQGLNQEPPRPSPCLRALPARAAASSTPASARNSGIPCSVDARQPDRRRLNDVGEASVYEPNELAHAALRGPQAESASSFATAAADRQVASREPRGAHFSLCMDEWLRSVDESGFLMKYAAHFEQLYGTVDSVCGAYHRGRGPLLDDLFRSACVTKLGHRRLLERWFEDNSSVQD
eukprot:TRINITY_DN90882_c0_g1_i1.p1 TRINITY_DN90882_c0_g1~~TRINITY_DN90882_c0_g1_i1.p1  ORF type:complete len:287 (-),score=15.67 TRINITY_DN90882_c0_g1_i1:70-819(-)